MKPLRVLLSWMRGLFRARQMDQDLRDQINAHIEEATQENLQKGLSPAEARRAAMLSFGSVVQTEEEHRAARGPWPRDLVKDIRYGLRALRRNPGFATVAIVSLAAGIGANTAIFSIVNSVLFRPRPIGDPERFVELYCGERENARERPYETCSYPSYVDLRDGNEVLSGLAGYGISQFNLGDAHQVEQVWGEVVSGNYFDVLGVQPFLGRAFVPEEDQAPGRNPVVVISHGLWQRRFNSDPHLIGQTVVINRQKLTVVGVAPPQYTGMLRGLSSEVWVPAMVMPLLEPANGASMVSSRGSRWMILLGRLKPGATLEQARARFDVLSHEMQAAHPEEWKSSQRSSSGAIRELFVSVVPESESRVHPGMRLDVYGLVALLMAIVNVVLLIACINLAGMLLARAVVRRKEIAVRLALGASRLRIVRKLVAESVLLSLIAGVAGLVLTAWLLSLVFAFMPAMPEGIRVALDLRLDWRVLVYTMGFSTLTGILFGLAPALQSSKVDVVTTLKNDSAFAGGYRQSRLRGGLVVLQVAFSLVLLIGAGLVLRSLEKVKPTRLGFSSEHVVVATVALEETRYGRAQSQEFYRRVSEEIAALPGVQAASLVEGMPGDFMGGSRRSTEIEGYQPGPGESLHLSSIFAGPHYFTNMKIPILQGRDFDQRDREGAPCVAIVNEAFVQRYFAETGSALGRHLAKFDSGRNTKEMCQIVGVVRDNQLQSLQREVQPRYALALYQSHSRRMTLLVHTSGDPAAHVKTVRSTLQGLDPNIPVQDVQTVLEYFSAMVYPFRLLGVVIGACGVMALLLATIGIYGIVSYSVAQRTREVGIRMALGAMKNGILGKMVFEGMALVAGGLALGLLLSVALTGVLSSVLAEFDLLFGVSATDTLTFAGVTILLALVALVACYVPALRVTKISPVEALRYE